MKKCFSNLTFLAFLLILPICLCSNIAAPLITHNQQVSIPTSQQSRTEKWLNKYLKKLTPTNDADKKRRRERIALWVIAGLAALTVAYLLQGSLWLTVIAVLVGVGINWRKIFPRRYSEYETPYMQYEEKENKAQKISPATDNKFSTRSLLLLLGYILSIVAAIVAASILSGGTLAIILFLAGILFLIASFVNAIKSVQRKESLSILAMIFSSVFLAMILVLVFSILAFAL